METNNIINDAVVETAVEVAEDAFVNIDLKTFGAGFGTGAGVVGLGLAAYKYGVPKVKEWWQNRKDAKAIKKAQDEGTVTETEGNVVDEEEK